MDIQTLTFIFVGATFALYIAIAIWSRAGNTDDFYVAGGGVSPLANGMATAADWMSAASFISMAGIISFVGRDGSVYLMGWTGGYVLLALLLAPYLRKFGKYTVPDFVGDRYYSNVARIVAVVCVLFVSFTYVAGQMRGVGIVFSRFLEVDINHGRFDWHDDSIFLCCSWGNERNHIYPGGAVLCLNFCISGSGYFYFHVDDGKPYSANRALVVPWQTVQMYTFLTNLTNYL